ncbi:GMC oxidoreductase [Desulfococcus sp.]|uniref:GMC oxidoreductase n=1 Tax=Desulfococcus sp. TaxID=2025834 RepID=UPI0035944957
MFIDARTIDKDGIFRTDVCIAGAGVAGITLAREFMASGFDTCIVESGGFKPDKATQALYYGENIGLPYYPLDTARGRFFAGTAHYWGVKLPGQEMGVRLRALDPIDFEKREWVPHSGWPFDKAHLDPYYERAHRFLKIGPYTYESADWVDPDSRPAFPFVGDRVKTTMFQFARRDIFFKDFRDEIDRAESVKTLLHGNVAEIETTESGNAVTGFRIACLNGNHFRVEARLYILAMGAIEIPRLLLLSDKVWKPGIGNNNDLVGRFFMEHPHLWTGNFVPAGVSVSNAMRLYEVHRKNGTNVMGKIAIGEATLREEKLLNWVTSIHPDFRLSQNHYLCHDTPGVIAYRELKKNMLGGRMPVNLLSHLKNMMVDGKSIARATYRKFKRTFKRDFERNKHVAVCWLNPMVEQAPNPDSRVVLGEERDAIGQRRVSLDWRLTSLDTHTFTRAQEILDEELRKAGLGHLIIHTRADQIPRNVHGGWHHMGTTRMNSNPKHGVVDEHCRVHGVGNLFVAGASVFPTSGYANPVLTTVAIVMRLADHVKEITARGNG